MPGNLKYIQFPTQGTKVVEIVKEEKENTAYRNLCLILLCIKILHNSGFDRFVFQVFALCWPIFSLSVKIPTSAQTSQHSQARTQG